MSIRRLVVVALLASAGIAHAEVVPAAPAPSFLTNWTTGNGTDVIASGALAGNVSLIGGISHAAGGSSASLQDVLFGKASSTAGATELFFEKGVQGNYLLGSDNAALAARLGNSTSVQNTNNGVNILDGATKPAQGGINGGGNAGMPSNPGNSGNSGNSGNAGNSGGNGNSGNTPAAGGDLPGLGNGSDSTPGQVDIPGNGIGLEDDAEPAQVPEPSTVALMLAGLVGAGSLARRRKQ